MKAKRPVILLILDGWGLGEDDAHNAIFLANTPTIDTLLATYPNGPIGAAGEHIGLEAGHQGSTEIGHLIISAGRNVLLPQMQMQRAIDTREIFTNTAYQQAMQRVKKTGSRLHLMGLLSNSGVHSYDATCHLLLEMAAKEGIPADRVFVHIFSDGRDASPTALPNYVKALQTVMQKTGVGIIADVQGRYWAMDRDHRWERVEAAYALLTEGKGMRSASSIEEAIELARTASETDEFIQPTNIHPNGHFHDDDVVINFNYRVDREIEITKALIEPSFTEFSRNTWPRISYVGTFEYYHDMPATHAFERAELHMQHILPEVLSAQGFTQCRVTETEKWVYVTKIFNGMREKPFAGEDRHLIPSDSVATYDEKPEMQAVPIATYVAEELKKRAYDFYLLNICNADILGHTGSKEATIQGCEAIDNALAILYTEALAQDAILVVTADHGDAELMWDHEGNMPHTQHTDSFVPFILIDEQRKHVRIRETGSLQDVAPTILELLNIPQPTEMTGESLLIDPL